MAVTIARTPWIDDDGTGTTGTILNNAVKTELYNQIDGALAQTGAASSGVWTPTPFNPAHFAAGAGTWTVTAGQVLANSYTIIGKTMHWNLFIFNSTLSAASATLYITLPAGVTNPGRVSGRTAYAVDGGGGGRESLVQGLPGTPHLELTIYPTGQWASGTTSIGLFYTLPIP